MASTETLNPFLPSTYEKKKTSSEIDSNEAMKSFALELLKNPLNPHDAARKAFPENIELQTNAALNWKYHPQVLDYQRELIEKFGADEFLPKKEEVLHEIYDRARKTRDNDEFEKLIKHVVSIMGWVKKEGTTINNNLQLNVMEVPKIDSDEQWQKEAMSHQSNLKRISLEQSEIDRKQLDGNDRRN